MAIMLHVSNGRFSVSAIVNLQFQEPAASSGHLLEALLEACEGAHEGGAVFSFATANGVRLLLANKGFHRFMTRADSFELVVGIDAITNVAALEAIEAVDAKCLRARAFLNDRRPLLFHPKFAWFRHGDRTRLVLGSGNLTAGGLRSNWEAFTVIELGAPENDSLHKTIELWFKRSHKLLAPLDDPRVRARAERNTGRERDVQIRPSDDEGRELEQEEIRIYEPDEPVLVAELSKSRGGARQANFHSEHFEGYFGASRDVSQQSIFCEVQANGILAAKYEERASVWVESRNGRYELDGVKRHEYPDGDLAPIAVFVKTAGGIFIYRVLWPGDPGHRALEALLSRKDRPRTGRSRMRQVRATTAELASAWRRNPLLRATPHP